jgi:NodT family efflux transporter outer membrane factor (OMF) lipoprotein
MSDFSPPFLRLSGPGPFLLAAGLLSACSSPAPYPQPEVAVPAQFSQAALFRQGNPAAADVPDTWWTVFRDPVLDELQTRLLAGNLNLQAAAAAVDAAQAALASSRAGALPAVGLNAGATRSASPGSSPATAYTAQGVLATWELDLWGRVRAGVDAADARLQASRATLAGTRLSLQATLVQTYFSLRSSQALQGILVRSLESYAQSLALVQNRYHAGVATPADVAQARSQWLSTQAQLEEARLQGTQLRHALALLLGQAPGAFEVAASPLPTVLPAVPALPDQLPAQLLERRPDIAAAQRQVAAANAQVGAAEAAFFPVFTLSASAGGRGSALAGLFQAPQQLWSLGTAVAVSLFDGGARTAARASAQASHQQAVATYRQTVLTALQEVEDNLASATQLGRSAELQTQALAAAQQALAVLQNQYKAGTVAYLNVLTAQNTVLSAERSLLDARNRQLAAVNQLLKNVAGRWV